jgi:adenosylmethionine-8-amino-7-oxononanoate aminotransferase
VFATDAVAEPIAAAGMNVMFHTFGAHPAACAAADEVLRILTDEQLIERAARIGETLRTRLASAFDNHPHVVEVRGRGLLQALEIVTDRTTLTPFPVSANVTNRVIGAALKRGVFFYMGGTGDVRDIVCIGPPFTIDERDVDTIVGVLSESVDDVLRP